MKRRQFLHTLPLLTSALALPAALSAKEQNANRANIYRGLDGQDLAAHQIPITGKLPAQLRGTLYRNGPALFERNGIRYRHWFDGDGMVQAFHIKDKGVSHIGRFVRTRKFVAESEAGQFLLATFGTVIQQNGLPSPDAFNTANTNVLPHAGKLFALWEGGSAYELEPNTLATLEVKNWRADLKGMPFSAHPKIEPDGTLWNFGVNPVRGQLMLYQIDSQGELKRTQLISIPGISMVHDFVVSAHHLIFLIPAVHLDLEKARSGISFLDSHVFRPNEALRILVIDKNDFTKKYYELPPGFVFHLGNACEEKGILRFDFVASDHKIMTEWMPALIAGQASPPLASNPAQVTINMKANAVHYQQRSESVEFPRIDPRVVGQTYRYVYYPTSQNQNQLNAVMRLDLVTGKTNAYVFGDDFIAEEHVLVPYPGSTLEGEGWLIGTVYDVKRNRTLLNVFAADHLADGPLAQASLPYALPLGFHGNFRSA